jgi:hypothetical protein
VRNRQYLPSTERMNKIDLHRTASRRRLPHLDGDQVDKLQPIDFLKERPGSIYDVRIESRSIEGAR